METRLAEGLRGPLAVASQAATAIRDERRRMDRLSRQAAKRDAWRAIENQKPGPGAQLRTLRGVAGCQGRRDASRRPSTRLAVDQFAEHPLVSARAGFPAEVLPSPHAGRIAEPAHARRVGQRFLDPGSQIGHVTPLELKCGVADDERVLGNAQTVGRPSRWLDVGAS